MTIKSHPKPVVDFESNSKSVKSNKGFTQKNMKVIITQIINKSV